MNLFTEECTLRTAASLSGTYFCDLFSLWPEASYLFMSSCSRLTFKYSAFVCLVRQQRWYAVICLWEPILRFCLLIDSLFNDISIADLDTGTWERETPKPSFSASHCDLDVNVKMCIVQRHEVDLLCSAQFLKALDMINEVVVLCG